METDSEVFHLFRCYTYIYMYIYIYIAMAVNHKNDSLQRVQKTSLVHSSPSAPRCLRQKIRLADAGTDRNGQEPTGTDRNRQEDMLGANRKKP